MLVFPTNLTSDRQPMPPDTKVLGAAYATPNLSTSISLFLVLFSRIFKASQSWVANMITVNYGIYLEYF
jgi:hypothetical protein